jgi:CheY-like chemotaxis protein
MGNSARILIADDSRANAEALAASLAIDGLETHFAQSGVDAIQLPRFWQPHVFVLDIGIRNIMVSPSQECCGVCPRPAMRASSSLRLWEKPNSSRPGPWLTSTTVTARKEAPRAAFEDDQWDACIAASLEQRPLDNAVTFEHVTNRAPGEPARIRADMTPGVNRDRLRVFKWMSCPEFPEGDVASKSRGWITLISAGWLPHYRGPPNEPAAI